jgi:predicted NUDIX family NTP pyrophosphohydrolase
VVLAQGEIEPEEQPLEAARREFTEETGFDAAGDPLPLGKLKQPSGKIVHAWAIEGDCDPASMRSLSFTMEWPPRSGKLGEFPEVDRVAWFGLEEAERRITRGQKGFLEVLRRVIGDEPPPRAQGLS